MVLYASALLGSPQVHQDPGNGVLGHPRQRTVERIEQPSTRADITRVRCFMVSRFMPTLYLTAQACQ